MVKNVSSYSSIRQTDDRESNFFMQLNSMEVKGEWIRDVDEPKITREILDDGTLTIKAKVKIEARAISNEATDFEVKVLRNGTDLRFVDTNFKTNDDMYLYLKTPVDGYVVVYLIDETPTAYCLLPYGNDKDGQQPRRMCSFRPIWFLKMIRRWLMN